MLETADAVALRRWALVDVRAERVMNSSKEKYPGFVERGWRCYAYCPRPLRDLSRTKSVPENTTQNP